jgi:hypothetical protein
MKLRNWFSFTLPISFSMIINYVLN